MPSRPDMIAAVDKPAEPAEGVAQPRPVRRRERDARRRSGPAAAPPLAARPRRGGPDCPARGLLQSGRPVPANAPIWAAAWAGSR